MLQLISYFCGSLWRLVSLWIEVRRILCVLGGQLLSYFFRSPRWCVLCWYQKRGRALQVCYSSSFWARQFFSDDVSKTFVMCCHSLLMGNNSSALSICNCFDLNFLKCFIKWINTKKPVKTALCHTTAWYSVSSRTKDNFWSPTSNPLQLSSFPSQAWFIPVFKP